MTTVKGTKGWKMIGFPHKQSCSAEVPVEEEMLRKNYES